MATFVKNMVRGLSMAQQLDLLNALAEEPPHSNLLPEECLALKRICQVAEDRLVDQLPAPSPMELGGSQPKLAMVRAYRDEHPDLDLRLCMRVVERHLKAK